MLAAAGVCVWIAWRLDAIRPGSLSRSPESPLRPGAAAPILLLGFVVFLLPQFAAAAAIVAVGGPDGTQAGTLRATGSAMLASYTFGIAAGAIGCWLAVRAGLIGSSAVRFSPRDAAVGAAALLLSMPVILVVSHATRLIAHAAGADTGGALQHGTLEILTQGPGSGVGSGHGFEMGFWWIVVLAGAVLGAPIVEEITFRGLLQPAVSGVLGRWAGVLVTSAIFTALHVPASGGESADGPGGATWLAIPTIAALSIALGIARERTGRLGVPIAMHIGFNAINVVLAFVETAG